MQKLKLKRVENRETQLSFKQKFINNTSEINLKPVKDLEIIARKWQKRPQNTTNENYMP
jgi:hypothetical protein